MRNFMKQSKAITLIALVITIIVLLILAGVTIATLTGDNGLLQKAANSKQANEEASALEKIKVEVVGSYGLDGKIDKEQLIKNLKNVQGLTYKDSTINENTIIDNFPATVKLNEYSFTISENGDVDKIQWIDNNNGSYTNAETGQTLTVGDTVKYETILTENPVNSIKLDGLKTDLSKYSGDNSSANNSSIDRNSLTWKVLDIKDGNIRLISSNPTSKLLKLQNADGYNNAVYLIDKACDVLYSVNGVSKSQNLKIEDIEDKINKTKFDYTQYENLNVDTKKYGGTIEFTSNLLYPNIYANEIGCKAISSTDNTENILGLSQQTSPITGSSSSSGRLKITQTYWTKLMESTDFSNSQYYTLFMVNGYPKYWLSSRCVNCGSDGGSFDVYVVEECNVKLFYTFGSNGNYNHTSYGYSLRPVVTLNSNVQLEPDGTNTWKIK